MTGEIGEVFTVLLTGEGAFIGFIIIASIMVLVSLKVKIMSWLFIVVSVLLSLYCFQTIAVDAPEMWVSLLYMVNCPILLFIGVKEGF